MDPIQNRAEGFGPVGLQLSIGQLLGLSPIIDSRETVFASTIADPCSSQLLGQPLPVVETEIHGKREPTLHPRMHEAKNRVQKVVVEKQTLTHFEDQMDLFSLTLTAHRVGLARLHRRKDHD